MSAGSASVTQSIVYFLLAGLMEIGGGYLIWLWLRERRPWWLAVIGALTLVGYGVVPTLQPAQFGRVYAAYGGVFIALSLLWGWWVDGYRPDRWDLIGAAFCLTGVALIMYAPRSS
jgi:small multidrug resistance family-3 protein